MCDWLPQSWLLLITPTHCWLNPWHTREQKYGHNLPSRNSNIYEAFLNLEVKPPFHIHHWKQWLRVSGKCLFCTSVQELCLLQVHFILHTFFGKIWDEQSNIVITLSVNVRANSNSMKGFQLNLYPFPIFPGIALCGTCRTTFWKEILSSAKLLI